jgi:haloalkane dehalogenase
MLNTDELPKHTCEVDGKRMAYVELGEGPPIVFLHGNPASSYIWRNIMPVVAPHGRCIAPDLIGMGDSEKLEGDDPMRYGFLQHRRFVEGLLNGIGVTEEVVLVGQDWGGALAMDWASRHRESVRGIVYFETIVRSRSWDEMDQSVREMFERIRSPEGETLVLRDNLFVEKSFSERMLRRLSDAEWAVYRRPYLNAGEDRRPTLTFPRELPINGKPHHTAEAVKAYSEWMAINDVPKLFIDGDPGAIIIGPIREFCRSWKHQEEVRVKGKHFLQEDSPLEISEAIANWLKRLPRLDSKSALATAI